MYAAAAARIADALTQDLLLAPLEAGVISLAHQLYALSRAMSDDRIRHLLADEVGLEDQFGAWMLERYGSLHNLPFHQQPVRSSKSLTSWPSNGLASPGQPCPGGSAGEGG